MRLSQKEKRVLKTLGWSYQYSIFKFSKEVEIVKRSPLGEDIDLFFPIKGFKEAVNAYYENFDPEEHVLVWAEHKYVTGDSSVPSIFLLCEDALAIDEMLRKLAYSL